jgi:hypothetical protein
MERPEMFRDLDLYTRMMKITSSYHYRMNARRFLQDIFDGIEINEETLGKFTRIDSRVLRSSNQLLSMDRYCYLYIILIIMYSIDVYTLNLHW